jgi:hypothetical protein
MLHADPVRELKLQAVRIGDLGIAAIPNEVFAITGLKIKAQSPLPATFNIELANGAEGYIPPPEQHRLGGYTTWPARTAALEVEAEPKIVEALLQLLETVAGRPRRTAVETSGVYVRSVLASRPEAYWRMNEFSAPAAIDVTRRHRGAYQKEVAFYLPGPQTAAFSGSEVNRAVHLAGGWFAAQTGRLASTYSVEMWFWNGLPDDVRATTAHLITRGSDQLVIAGQGTSAGRLVFRGTAGATKVSPRFWNHLALVRDDRSARVYLNGRLEITASVPGDAGGELFIGGHEGTAETLEGKIDEVAVYSRALKAREIAERHKLSGM